MPTERELQRQIEALEDKLKDRERRIDELREERDQERELVLEMREHVDECNQMIDAWIEAFDMRLNDKGEWDWSEAHLEEMTVAQEVYAKYRELQNEWNKFVGEYNDVV